MHIWLPLVGTLWPPWCSGGLRGVTGDRTDCSHGYFIFTLTRLFIREIRIIKLVKERGSEVQSYSWTGEVSCQCEDGWQRLGSRVKGHQHSTQTWCSQGQLLQVRKGHAITNPSGVCLMTLLVPLEDESRGHYRVGTGWQGLWRPGGQLWSPSLTNLLGSFYQPSPPCAGLPNLNCTASRLPWFHFVCF